jgi:hypothetical protein
MASITLGRETAPAVHYEWMTFPQPDGTVTYNITTSSGFGPGTSWTTPEVKLDAPLADKAAVRVELSRKVWGYIAATNGMTVAEVRAVAVRDW